jgi:hypothetical protein
MKPGELCVIRKEVRVYVNGNLNDPSIKGCLLPGALIVPLKWNKTAYVLCLTSYGLGHIFNNGFEPA